MPNNVKGHGLGTADILFVYDYATREDVIAGYAISGKAEATLSQLLREQHVKMPEIYRTLLIKDGLSYYGKAKNRKQVAFDEAKKLFEPDSYEKILIDEIISIKPNVVVPLGDHSLNFLAGVKSLTKYRGSVLPIREDISKEAGKYIRVIPTFSPYDIWDNWTCRSYVSLDFAKIVKNRKNAKPIQEQGLLWICKTADAFNEFVKRQYKNAPYLTVDFETYLGVPTCMSFCFDGYEAVSVPLFDSEMDKANAALLLYNIAKLMASPIPKVNQNIKYDWIIGERFGIEFANIVGDTMLAAHLIYPELPKGLDFLTSVYTDIPYYKDEGKEWDPKAHRDRSKLYLYNAKDALSTHQIYSQQIEELKELNLHEFYIKKTIPRMKMYKEMDETGILVDRDVKQELLAKYDSMYSIHAATLKELAEDNDLNPRSSQQIGNLIYDVLRFPVRKHQTDGGTSTYNTDEETLEELMLLHGEDNKKGFMRIG
jgi:uracil-DNA glycosylase family 4